MQPIICGFERQRRGGGATARGSGAFTLIELLVVITIIGLLIAILLPALAKANATARRSACLSGVRQLAIGVVAYANDFQDWAPVDYSHETYPGGFTPVGPAGRYLFYNKWTNLGLLYSAHPGPVKRAGYVNDAKAYYCPGVVANTDANDSHGYYASRDALLDPRKTGWIMYHGYIYRVPAPREGADGFWRLDRNPNAAFLSDKVFNGTGTAMQQGHGIEGVNAAYTDGHARWIGDPAIYQQFGSLLTNTSTLSGRTRNLFFLLDQLGH